MLFVTEPFVEDAVQIGASAAGLGGGFYAIRWLILWLTGRADRRQDSLDQQDERIDREWQKIREKIEIRMEKVERQNEALRFAFHHVAGALVRIDPRNPALRQAEQVLEQAFPIDFGLMAERAEAALAKEEERHDHPAG